MAVFEKRPVLFALRNLPYKEKEKLKAAVRQNGGSVCFVVNKECSLVVADEDAAGLSASRLKNIRKFQTPVVTAEYVWRCVEGGALLPVGAFRAAAATAPRPPPSTFATRVVSKAPPTAAEEAMEAVEAAPADEASDRITQGSDLPAFPDQFQVAKYCVFGKSDGSSCCVVELQSARGGAGQQLYRLVSSWKDQDQDQDVRDTTRFPSTSEDALALYRDLKDQLKASGLQEKTSFPEQAQGLGSAVLQQLVAEEKLQTGKISHREVAVFVELLWTEALGRIDGVLKVSVDKLSLSDVGRAEGLLLQARKKLQQEEKEEVPSLLQEFYSLLPHRAPPTSEADLKFISEKLDLCQLVRDVLNVSEMNLRSPAPSCVGKYRALRCSIDLVQPGSAEYQMVASNLLSSKVQILQILRVCRPVEVQTFRRDLGNVRTLLHSSNPRNFVGILSRGLMLPRVLEERHGVQRRDVGHLGSGIYFSDHVGSALFYSKPSETDGSHLLLVCEVALGNCKVTLSRDPTLTRAPEGFHSVHGTSSPRAPTKSFQFDEFVVYSPDQVQLKYVVQFTGSQNRRKDFSPTIDLSAETSPQTPDPGLSSGDPGLEDPGTPLKDATAGLLDSGGQQLPLKAVHVKCRLMDLLSQVVVFQSYTNKSAVAIEAKYVFPLDDSAAVCGFEAFINGKHVVGQVKEKEAARKQYREAVASGHGAYLMDQDAADVFTVSVGNLPPGATVLVKVTFVSELVVKDGAVLFSLPGSVAPWQQSAALNQTTQVVLDKVYITHNSATTREFTLDMSVDMPFLISSIQCITHRIKMKRTDCKAVLSVLPGAVLGPDGFQLSITLAEVHLPRMWVEKHPDKDSQACMLVFYPRFEVASGAEEVVLLLDTSESMRGQSLVAARRIALRVLKNLDSRVRLNVVLFGTDHVEAFPAAQPVANVRQEAERFIKSASSVGGSTELWRPLRTLGLLPPSAGIRNLLLLSDGHIQNADATLRLLRDGVRHSRLFTCGLSSTANRHMLRTLAQAGGGAYEFFDGKAKHNWVEKVERQVKRMASPGCSSVSVKWQQFDPLADAPLQAPRQLHALFNDCHTLVFGFVPHCSQATLLGNLSGQELETMVSTSDLQKTTGTFLHKLTARALIRDYEDGNLDCDEGQHERRKAELRSFIVDLSKEFSVLSQFTSFVAVEDREPGRAVDAFTDVSKLVAEEDVDFLPYMDWSVAAEEKPRLADVEEVLEMKCLMAPVQSAWELSAPVSADPPPDSLATSPSASAAPPPDDALTMVQFEEFCRRGRRTKSRIVPQKKSKKSGQRSGRRATEYIDFDLSYTPHSFSPAGGGGGGDPPPPPSPPLVSQVLQSPPPPVLPRVKQLAVKARGLRAPRLELPQVTRECSSGIRLTPRIRGFSFAPQSNALPAPPPPPATALDRPPPSTFSYQGLRVQGSPAPPPDLDERSLVQSTLVCNSAVPSPSPPPPPPPASSAPANALDLYLSSTFSYQDLCMQHSPAPLLGRQRSVPHVLATPFSAFAGLPPTFATGFHHSAGPPPLPPPVFGGPHHSAGPPPLPPPVFGGPPPPPPSLMFASAPFSMTKSSLKCVLLKENSGAPPPAVTQRVASMPAARAPPTSPFDEEEEEDEDYGFSIMEADDDKTSDVMIGALEFGSAAFEAPDKTLTSGLFGSSAGFGSSAIEPKPFIFNSNSSRSTDRISVIRPNCLDQWESPSPTPEENMKLKWRKIFKLQHPNGFWEFTSELEDLINFRGKYFVDEFLMKKGLPSLGVKAQADVLRLLATALVLQLLRMDKLEEGKLLRTLFSLEDSSGPRSEFWGAVLKALDWVRGADRQYPSIYSRLEFGHSWEAATRQLLGYEKIPWSSNLHRMVLQRVPVPSVG
ncbi:unnamed protein product [Ophioblennius macclurei]